MSVGVYPAMMAVCVSRTLHKPENRRSLYVRTPSAFIYSSVLLSLRSSFTVFCDLTKQFPYSIPPLALRMGYIQIADFIDAAVSEPAH